MATRETSKTIRLQVPLEVSETDHQQMQALAGEENVLPRLTTWVRFLISQYISGGTMVSAHDVKALERALGSDVASAKQIIELALKGAGRDDGQLMFRIPLDPVWLEPLKEVAFAQGNTPEAVLAEIANLVVSNGWAYDWKPTGYTAHFTKQDQAAIEEFVGKPIPFGCDIAEAIRQKCRN